MLLYLAVTPSASAQHYTFTVLAGMYGTYGSADGTGAAPQFGGSGALALDVAGNLCVADTVNHTIRKVTPSGVVTTVAGLAGKPGSADGVGSHARFNSPSGIAVHEDGTIYVSDTGNHTIRRISQAGEVTTVVGMPGESGSADGAGNSARLKEPAGIAVDGSGTLYVADSGNATTRKVTHPGVLTTLAGLAGDIGTRDGEGTAARFARPLGVTLDGSNMVYVADHHMFSGGLDHVGGSIRKVSATGTVTTLARLYRSEFYFVPWCGYGQSCFLYRDCSVSSVAVDPEGRVYAVDRGGGDYCGPRMTGTPPTTSAFLCDCIRVISPTGAELRPATSGETYPALHWAIALDSRGLLYSSGYSTVNRGFVDDDVDGLPDSWERQFGLAPTSATGPDGAAGDPDGDGKTNAEEYAAETHPRGFVTRYLAEGATLDPFDTRLAILNPGTQAALAQLRFLDRSGRVTPLHLQVPGGGRATVRPAGIAGLESSEFSTTIESDVPLVVDRTMTWPRMDNGVYGGHAESAISAPAPVWYLAEGATYSGLDLFYLVQNPTDEALPVEVRYLRPAPAPALAKRYTVDPHSRHNIWVNQEDSLLSATDVSAVITSTTGTPIIVERAMYLSDAARRFDAGHESAGVTVPAAEWFLAEGATGPYFDLFVLVANPSDSDARMNATFLLPDGSSVSKDYVVAANSRFNIWVDHEDARLADTAVSTAIRTTNGVPVIVERAMWWPDGGWYEAHNSPGATTTGTRWALAEGEVDPARNLETYILIANTSAAPGEVKVTLLFEDGTTAQRTFAGIPASSRFNVPVGGFFPQAASKRFGAIVEGLGATPAQLVVERAMYWDAGGQRWAAGTNALATKLQ